MVLWIKALQRVASSGEIKHAAYKKKLADYFVFCSVTGDKIPLCDLKYWNVDLQEPYKGAKEALSRYTPTTSGA